MNTAPIRPARIGHDDDGTPRSLDHGDIYHPRAGALAQARHVFLAGNGLPNRWRGRARFVILETGFGLGHNFLATWSAWRSDAERCDTLHFVSIESTPPDKATLASLPRDPSIAALAAELAAAWPPLTWNLHRLAFDGGAVQLLLAFGDIAAWMPQLTAEVDAFFLDGFAPARNPAMWQPRLIKAMARMAAPNATVATWTAARPVREALSTAGFAVELGQGQGGKRDITLGRFAPRFVPPPLPRRAGAPAGQAGEPVVIVGAGLAGCATACALAELGRSSILVDRAADIASEGSGNAAGLFHGVVHGADGHHARWYRAAALAAASATAAALARGARGSVSGMLRIDASAAGLAAMQATLERLGLPEDYVRVVDADEASRLAGTAIGWPAWHFARGGWVDPRGLARSFLARAGSRVEVRLGVEVAAIRRERERWCMVDGSGRVVLEGGTLVLANAGGAFELLDRPEWGVTKSRGQVSAVSEAAWSPADLPRIPVAGAGYMLPPSEGLVWFGATSQRDDDDLSVRASDHLANVARRDALLGLKPHVEVERLIGRTGFRWQSDDRLPIIGAVPLACGGHVGGRLDQPRFVARSPGLFVIAALGSRGIASAALGGPVLAALIEGAPVPLEANLLDAIDPARFVSRASRREPRPTGTTATQTQPPLEPIAAGSTGG